MAALNDRTDRPSPAGTIAGWWHAWAQHWTSAAELAACSDEQVERMAQDVGLSAHDLQCLARHGSDASALLFRRMAALDLDREEVARADRATYLDLQRLCTMCDCKRRCARDLARDPHNARWEDYCPNVATLKMLSAMPG